MKSLYERLEPEILEGLEYNRKKYNCNVDIIVSELKSHKFWQDLTITQARQIIVFSDYPMAKVTNRTLLWGDNIIKDEDLSRYIL